MPIEATARPPVPKAESRLPDLTVTTGLAVSTGLVCTVSAPGFRVASERLEAGDAGGAAANACEPDSAGVELPAAAAGNAAGNSAAGSIMGSAASAFGSKLVSGLFAKKKTEPAAANTGAASAGAPASPLPPGMIQAAQITMETTSINPAAVPPAQFDIPAGWKLIPPPAQKAAKEFSCPKSGA